MARGYDSSIRPTSTGAIRNVAEALKHMARDKITVLTKTWSRHAKSVRADPNHFRRELGTEVSGPSPDARFQRSRLDRAL
jgi:hypothetical protein